MDEDGWVELEWDFGQVLWSDRDDAGVEIEQGEVVAFQPRLNPMCRRWVANHHRPRLLR